MTEKQKAQLKIMGALRATHNECQDSFEDYRNREVALLTAERYPEAFTDALYEMGIAYLTTCSRKLSTAARPMSAQQLSLYPPHEIEHLRLTNSITVPGGRRKKFRRSSLRQIIKHADLLDDGVRADQIQIRQWRALIDWALTVISEEQMDAPIGPILDAVGLAQREQDDRQEAA